MIIKFADVTIGDEITVRFVPAHTGGDRIFTITGTVVRKYKDTMHLITPANVNGSYELVKRTNIVEVSRG